MISGDNCIPTYEFHIRIKSLIKNTIFMLYFYYHSYEQGGFHDYIIIWDF